MSNSKHIIDHIKGLLKEDNSRPLPIVSGGSQPIPSFGDRVRVNRQIALLIYEVKTGDEDVALGYIQKNINNALNRDVREQIYPSTLAEKSDVVDFLQELSKEFGIQLNYEEVVHELKGHEKGNSETRFYVATPLIEAHYLI